MTSIFSVRPSTPVRLQLEQRFRLELHPTPQGLPREPRHHLIRRTQGSTWNAAEREGEQSIRVRIRLALTSGQSGRVSYPPHLPFSFPYAVPKPTFTPSLTPPTRVETVACSGRLDTCVGVSFASVPVASSTRRGADRFLLSLFALFTDRQLSSGTSATTPLSASTTTPTRTARTSRTSIRKSC